MASKTKDLYNRYTGVHVTVSEETFAGMNSSEWAPSSDATRKAQRERALGQEALGAEAASTPTTPKQSTK